MSTAQSLLEDEARAWDEGALEDLKKQRDCLVSMRDMFDRRDRYARDNIPQLERRIGVNEIKLQGLKGRPEGMVKPGEIEKIEKMEESIIRVSPGRNFTYLRIFHHEHFAKRLFFPLSRTKNQSWPNTPVAFSSKSVSVTKLSPSKPAFTTSASRIKIGLVNESSMQS